MKAEIQVLNGNGYVWDADGKLKQPGVPLHPCTAPQTHPDATHHACSCALAATGVWHSGRDGRRRRRCAAAACGECRWNDLAASACCGPAAHGSGCLKEVASHCTVVERLCSTAGCCLSPLTARRPASSPSLGFHAAFKQQNAVHGLPLELSAEEVTLAVEKGWGTLQSPLRMAELAVVLGGGGDGGRKRGREPSAYQYYDDDDVADQDADMADAQQQQPAAEPTWRAALAGSGGPFEIPTTPAEAAAANAGIDIAAAGKPTGSAVAGEPAAAEEGGAAGASGGAAGVEWAFPANNEEKHRYWVFRDLHSKG